jgi:hypothetical protein
MEAGAEQDLIGVNIPDTRELLLMHEQGFDPAATLRYQRQELIPWHSQRIVSKSPSGITLQFVRAQERQTAEPPGIPVAELRLAGTVQIHDKMGMLREANGGGSKEKQAGHAQLGSEETERPITPKRDDDRFATPLNSFHAASAVPIKTIQPLSDDIGSSDPAVPHPPPNDALSELNRGHFSLW